MALYREDLDEHGCDGTQCGELHGPHEPIRMWATCHRTGKLEVYYAAGVLTTRCCNCRQIIAEIAVAIRPERAS